jgi:hypothetical protein
MDTANPVAAPTTVPAAAASSAIQAFMWVPTLESARAIGVGIEARPGAGGAGGMDSGGAG